MFVGDTQNKSSATDHDEIRNHAETRYVRPVEACWLSKSFHDKSHSIMRLPVHLPN